jgi:hypothetical protein
MPGSLSEFRRGLGGSPGPRRIQEATIIQASNELDATCINTIRTLSMDAVQAASSGHPGAPMALPPVGKGLFVTDIGNHNLDCRVEPIADAPRLEMDIRAIPGVAGTGLFLGRADTVLVGDWSDFRMIADRRRAQPIWILTRTNHEPVQKTA